MSFRAKFVPFQSYLNIFQYLFWILWDFRLYYALTIKFRFILQVYICYTTTDLEIIFKVCSFLRFLVVQWEASAGAKTPRFGIFFSGTFFGVSESSPPPPSRGDSTTIGVLQTPLDGERGSMARCCRDNKSNEPFLVLSSFSIPTVHGLDGIPCKEKSASKMKNFLQNWGIEPSTSGLTVDKFLSDALNFVMIRLGLLWRGVLWTRRNSTTGSGKLSFSTRVYYLNTKSSFED